MCGIAGQIVPKGGNYIENHKSSYEAMLNNILRRGPDQNAMYFDEQAALLHARLAVIDLENGRQPMIFNEPEARELVLLYNGELYNTDEVRDELKSLGHVFKTRSDTEVVGRSFIQWGENCVHKLNGIFAFAIWDAREKVLFLARDRIGVKPLFYTLKNGSLIFASEIPALLAHEDVEAVLDRNGVAEIIFLGPGRTPGCGVLRGIEELEPGCFAVFKNGSLAKTRYWRLIDREQTDSFRQAVEKTRFLVTDSIRRQLVSDVPVCTLLSGGLDSSIISAIADRHMTKIGRKLTTFSVGYENQEKFFKAGKFQPSSDDDYIKIMNASLNAEHRDVIIDTPELAEALFEAVDARGLPGMADVDSSMLLLFREIKKHATVGISGECADELFGGYPWYRDPEVRARYGFPWAQSTAWRQSFLAPRFEIDGAEFVDERYRETLADTDCIPGLSPEERRLREMVNLNFRWFMQTLLDRKDRMSMYSGLEVRVPFCDYRLAELLYSMPWEFKDYKGVEKGLLREAMRGLLPEAVLWRKKSPYPKTHNPSYLADVSLRLRRLLERSDAPIFQIVRRDALEKLLSSTVSVPWYGQLMTVPQTIAYFLQVNYWLEKYSIIIDN
ncbi:MAG: asparagine synthase (glutamine-hydrolyzing) [Oscillospiraceae bacterium]|jgi:asparagine synthase (glutamine-hydrolysing)|nr:asparagine synthase (glutamine-hydrolyzing) [Oscillospiraceae bacterium]